MFDIGRLEKKLRKSSAPQRTAPPPACKQQAEHVRMATHENKRFVKKTALIKKELIKDLAHCFLLVLSWPSAANARQISAFHGPNAGRPLFGRLVIRHTLAGRGQLLPNDPGMSQWQFLQNSAILVQLYIVRGSDGRVETSQRAHLSRTTKEHLAWGKPKKMRHPYPEAQAQKHHVATAQLMGENE